MAEFYQEIVQAYFELIPAAQRYGITSGLQLTVLRDQHGDLMSLLTLDLDYNRKHAYGGFANGLAGKILFKPSN